MSNTTAGCGSPTCNPKNVALNLFTERGRISQTLWERISAENPFLGVLAPTKQPFPSGTGETMTRRILNVHNPRETDVLGWSRVGGATPGNPGYSPCCVTYKPIPYGDRYVSACLYQDGWKSPTFCVTDLVFKHQWEEVLQQFEETMANWTRGIWGNWSVMAFQSNVTCATLNSEYGLPEDHGKYPNPPPTSVLTFQHCEEFYMRLQGVGAELTSVAQGYQVIFIGSEQFRKLEYEYLKDAADLGARHTERAVDMWFPSLGRVKAIDKFMFVMCKFPRRFRAKQTGETWDDCIIPHSTYVQSTHGTNEVRNPDYYNRNIAVYEEILFYNMGAVNWLTPPEPLSTGLGGFLRPQNYAGEFILFNQPTDCDPKGKMGTFYADFMSGMIANFPDRARAVLALAQHNASYDVCPEGCMTGQTVRDARYHVLGCATLLNGNLQLLVKGTLPETCPDGTSLFAVDKAGNRWIIDTVHDSSAYAGDSINTEGGTIIEVSFPEDYEDVQNCRTECDGWDYVTCLSSLTPSSDPVQSGCQGCSPNTVSDACTFTFEFDSVRGPVALKSAAGSTLVTFTDPDNATTVASNIQTYLTANGGGTVAVTLDEFHYVIVITGAAAAGLAALKAGAYITYDGGLGYPETVAAQTGDCD